MTPWTNRASGIALYTGNDDNIVIDLLSWFDFGGTRLRITGGLLGHWAAWTRRAVELLDRIHAVHRTEAAIPADWLTLASEVGVWDYAEADVVEKGRVGPGEMFAVDTASGKLWRSREIDDNLKARRPYADWLAENTIRIQNVDEQEAAAAAQYMADSSEELPVYQKLFGVSNEEREHVIRVMAEDSVEATGSRRMP